MAENDALGEDEATETADKRERSTIVFPYGDLNEATSVARALHSNVGNGEADLDQVAGWMGQSMTSGAFRTKVNSARIFGLVSTGRSKLRLTSIGQQIVNPDTEADARVKAFLNVPLYSRLFDDYKGTTLPPNVGLERAMVEYGVAEKQKDKARQTFQRSADQAAFFKEGNNKLVRPGVQTHVNTPEPEKETKGSGGPPPPPAVHPFIKGLVETLPPAGDAWTEEGQEQWLAAAKAIFKLIYPAASAPQQPSERSQTDAPD